MSTTHQVLTVSNLSIDFAGAESYKALASVSFAIPKGKSVALLGASGSGKSVTSLAIMGLLPPNAIVSGGILLEGTPLKSDTDWTSIRGKDISMIFQEPMSALNPLMSCGEQILENILIHQKVSRKVGIEKTLSWMQKVQLPEPQKMFHKFPHELSGGQKQRIMIAMALCNEPKLIIADEPTTALDVVVQKDILVLLKTLQKAQQTSLLFITHDMGVAKYMADEVVILDKGRVVSHSLQDYTKQYTLTTNTQMQQIEQKEASMVLDNLSIHYPLKRNIFGKVSHYFTAVDRVNLVIPASKTIGLVGGSGCGKSTISKCIMGIVPASSGNIWYEGKNLTTLNTAERKKNRKEIQMIFQDPNASLSPKFSAKDLFTELLNVHKLYLDKTDRKKYIATLFDKVGLPINSLEKYPHEFSGGQKQRLCIARALAVQPNFIICDESTAALDAKMQYQILQLLKEIQIAEKLTYLFITHDLQIAEQFCDEIVVMDKGQIVEKGNATDVLQHPQHAYTKMLKAAML